MDLQLDQIIKKIRPDTIGLLEFIQDLTGLNYQDIILQAIFLFYPYQFVDLGTGVHTWIIFEKRILKQYNSLKQHYGIEDDSQMVLKLFDLEPNPNDVNIHLDLDLLTEIVEHTIGFDARIFISQTETDRLEYFIETCILQYILTVYPDEIIKQAFNGISDHFFKIEVTLGADQIAKLVDMVSPSFANKNFDHEVKKRIFKMFNQLSSFQIL